MEFFIHMPDLPGPIREMHFHPPLSDAELEAFCRKNEALRIERTRQENVTVMTPVVPLHAR